MTLDPETWGSAIASLIIGLTAGGTAIRKWTMKGMPGNGSFKKELTDLEKKVDDVYLSKFDHGKDCKLARYEGQISLRVTLDEVFRERDKIIKERFDDLSKQVSSNREVVLEHYRIIINNLKDLNGRGA
jgi:hypothetical protein